MPHPGTAELVLDDNLDSAALIPIVCARRTPHLSQLSLLCCLAQTLARHGPAKSTLPPVSRLVLVGPVRLT